MSKSIHRFLELKKIFLFQFIFTTLLLIELSKSEDGVRRYKRISDEKEKFLSKNESFLVGIYQNKGNNKQFLCSGVLVAQNVVLTAGHCVSGIPAAAITVLGFHDKKSSLVDYHWIAEIFKPQDYGDHFQDIDLAILSLRKSFSTAGAQINPIEICNKKMENGDQLQVSCWARRSVNVTYISAQKCSNEYFSPLTLTRNMFCGQLQNEENVCLRESGGPVVHNGKLCGIVLQSGGWLSSKNPEVYMSVKPINRLLEYIIKHSA